MGGLNLSRVLIVGLGRSGLAAARLAARDGAEVWITDQRREPEFGTSRAGLPSDVRRFLGGHPLECLEGVDLLIVSPGVAPDVEILRAARERKVSISTEVEFAWMHAPDAPLVAVTGSNGKSTVTMLTVEMLVSGGVAAVAGGNLGTAACELVMAGGWECWVLEISSFQAELLTRMKPSVGIFLNLSQDHLERHPDMASYGSAKKRLFAYQGASDVAVLNADDDQVVGTPTAARRRLFSLEGPADAWFDGQRLMLDGRPFVDRSDVALPGVHNIANALAATLAAVELGARPEDAAAVLGEFAGLDHRHLTIHEADGVRWVDDSKATNVGAALAALRGYPDGSVHLILGGQAKGQDFSTMVPEVRRAAACVYLIGIDGPTIGNAIAGTTPVVECGTLDEAVRRARGRARSGQWVVLAPACASFDQFAGYHERGQAFAELARREEAPCP